MAPGKGAKAKGRVSAGPQGGGGLAGTVSAKKTAAPEAVLAQSASRSLSYSLKARKGGLQLEATVHIPRSTPDSVLNVDADEAGLRVDTGKWGGGYALAVEWPAPFAGRVRAGKDVEVEAQLQPGRLQLVFDLEKPQAFKGGVSTDDADRASKNGTKRALNEPGPNKKRREKAKLKQSKAKKKGAGASASGQGESDSAERGGAQPAPAKKQKRLVEDTKDLMTFIESIGEAKEAQIEDKLAKERARDEAVSGIKHKQEARKAAKVGKKQQLKQTLKANLKEAGRGKNKARKSGKSKAEEAGGDAQEGEGAAHDKKRRRVSWGQDQEREFFS